MKNAFLLVLCLPLFAAAQTGGTYQIEKSVVASGGGASAGGNYSLESTTGQPVAGNFVQASTYSAYSGFWTPQFAPTAATVPIGGRVTTADGRGILNARVMLTAPNGATQFSLTGSFGFYQFHEIPVGETYILTVFSKRFTFANPTQVVTVTEEMTELNFTAEP